MNVTKQYFLRSSFNLYTYTLTGVNILNQLLINISFSWSVLFKDFIDEQIFRISAYVNGGHEREISKSLMNNTKHKGPKLKHCSMPKEG